MRWKGFLKIPLTRQWFFQFNYNKHPYSKCLNPHIGFFTHDRSKSLYYEFNPDWKIWNLNLFGPRFDYLTNTRTFLKKGNKMTDQLSTTEKQNLTPEQINALMAQMALENPEVSIQTDEDVGTETPETQIQ